MARVTYREAPGAERVIEREAGPQTEVAAEAIASGIPGNVPVNQGVAKRTYRTSVQAAATKARVSIGSPFWHFLEYGTRFNSAYRPIQRTVAGLGMRYTPK